MLSLHSLTYLRVDYPTRSNAYRVLLRHVPDRLLPDAQATPRLGAPQQIRLLGARCTSVSYPLEQLRYSRVVLSARLECPLDWYYVLLGAPYLTARINRKYLSHNACNSCAY